MRKCLYTTKASTSTTDWCWNSTGQSRSFGTTYGTQCRDRVQLNNLSESLIKTQAVNHNRQAKTQICVHKGVNEYIWCTWDPGSGSSGSFKGDCGTCSPCKGPCSSVSVCSVAWLSSEVSCSAVWVGMAGVDMPTNSMIIWLVHSHCCYSVNSHDHDLKNAINVFLVCIVYRNTALRPSLHYVSFMNKWVSWDTKNALKNKRAYHIVF